MWQYQWSLMQRQKDYYVQFFNCCARLELTRVRLIPKEVSCCSTHLTGWMPILSRN